MAFSSSSEDETHLHWERYPPGDILFTSLGRDGVAKLREENIRLEGTVGPAKRCLGFSGPLLRVVSFAGY